MREAQLVSIKDFGLILRSEQDQLIPIPKPDLVLGQNEVIENGEGYDPYGQYRVNGKIKVAGRFLALLEHVTVLRNANGAPRWIIELSEGVFARESYRDLAWFAQTQGFGVPETPREPVKVIQRGIMDRSQWDDNYAHYIHEVLPRFDIAQQYRDWDTDWSEDGIDRYYFEQLLFPSFWPHISLSPDPVHWLRDRYGKPKYGDNVLWISRKDACRRRINNEDTVIKQIWDWGFNVQKFVPGQWDRDTQIQAAANASIIIGPHGAGMINSIFAHNAAVIEIMPQGYQHPMMGWLTQWAGNWYGKIVCDGGFSSDLTVDMDHLKAALTEAKGAIE